MTLTSSDLPIPMVFLLAIAILSIAASVLLYLRRHRYLSGEKPQNIQWADIWPSILFILIFSGPPKLRARDPLGSIRGDVDYVVLLHLLVWGLAGVWLFYQLVVRRLMERRPLLRLWIPQKLGLVLILCLGASALVSPAPALTILKVYETLVMLLFSLLFVQRYGVDACLQRLFVGSALLVIAIAVSAIIAPDLVMMVGGSRLTGELIAPAGDTSVFLLILLCANRQRLPTMRFLILFTLSIVVLIFSRARTAYACIGAVLSLVILLRPNLPILRRFAFVTLALLPLAIFSPSISDWIEREPESVSTLSDRTGLWTSLTDITLNKSPLIGLGYYAASRVYGPQYNLGLGTAHSEFIETLVGGGILSATVLVALWLTLFVYAASLLRQRKDRIPFVCFSLLMSIMLSGLTGTAEGPCALGFWCVAAILPTLRVTRAHSSLTNL
jgi:O-antigen ligase